MTITNAGRTAPLPLLSIVIPVRNEESHISSVLAELEQQDYPPDRVEVWVADGNSTDATAREVQEFARCGPLSIHLLQNPDQLSSAGRNLGVRNARGEYLIFIDGHCHIPTQTLLRDAVEIFEKTNADCLCRPSPLTTPGNSKFQDVIAQARATPLGHGRDSTIYSTSLQGFINPCSSGAFYRRSVFQRVGLFDESFDACEDVELNFRVLKAGLSSYFSPRLMLLYRPRANFIGLWRQMLRYGRGRFRLVHKHRGAFSWSQIVPAGLLAWWAAGAVVSLFSKHFASYYLVSLITYLGVVFGFSTVQALRFGVAHLAFGPGVYIVIHVGLGAGFLAELVSRVCRSARPRRGLGSRDRSWGKVKLTSPASRD
jgi:succinoglycan biosynthesis protein ExoA